MLSDKLIYIGDPMCSWCYGIANELKTIKSQFEDQLSFEIIMGGLRPYNTQSISELKSFLAEHWEHVEHRSGQQFKYDILNNDEITYDTEPPSRALVVVRKLKPTASFEFFSRVQEAFYLYNRNMHLAESYFDILEDLAIDSKIFIESFSSQEMKELVKEDFNRAASLGVRSFPTLLFKSESGYSVIARGYAKAENISANIETVLNKS